MFIPMQSRRAVLAFVAAGMFGLGPAAALEKPEGEVLLTVSGLIGQMNEGETAVFDRAMLEAMRAVQFATSTQWTDGVKTFRGVPLRAVLDAVGATGSVIEATALNNYMVTIPVAELRDSAPIIAYQIDGAPFSRREKGPLWVVFPYDSGAEYQTETVYGQSIWQLVGLRVTD